VRKSRIGFLIATALVVADIIGAGHGVAYLGLLVGMLAALVAVDSMVQRAVTNLAKIIELFARDIEPTAPAIQHPSERDDDDGDGVPCTVTSIYR
jgi:hypothetical protein